MRSLNWLDRILEDISLGEILRARGRKSSNHHEQILENFTVGRCNKSNELFARCPVSRTLFLKMDRNLLTFQPWGFDRVANLHLRRLWYQRLCSPGWQKLWRALWRPTISKQFLNVLYVGTKARTLEPLLTTAYIFLSFRDYWAL